MALLLPPGGVQKYLREKTSSARCVFIYLTLLLLSFAQQDDHGFAHNGPRYYLFLHQSLEPFDIELIEQQAEDRNSLRSGDVDPEQFLDNFTMVFVKMLFPNQ